MGAVFAEVPDGVAELLKDSPAALSLLRAVRTTTLRSLEADVAAGPFAHARALVDYLRLTMAYARREMVRVLYFTPTASIILDETVSVGSAIAAPFPMREILTTAIRVDAAGLIIVHNHPGGSPRPSERDIAATRKLSAGAALLDIVVHDHLIVARAGWTSFRELGLLPER